MQKVKIFKSVEVELNALEEEMNAWIESSGARIISITGNIAPQSAGALEGQSFGASDVLIVVLYEEQVKG